MWNLVAEETREGQVYHGCSRSSKSSANALGDRSSTSREAFRGPALRDLLIEAIRYGNRPGVKAQLDQVIDEQVGDGLAELVARARAHIRGALRCRSRTDP